MNYLSRKFDPVRKAFVAVKNYATEKTGKGQEIKHEYTPEEKARFKAFADLLSVSEGQRYLQYLDSRIAELKSKPRDVAEFTAEGLFRWNVSIEAKIEILAELREELATAEEKLGTEDINAAN